MPLSTCEQCNGLRWVASSYTEYEREWEGRTYTVVDQTWVPCRACR